MHGPAGYRKSAVASLRIVNPSAHYAIGERGKNRE
jgi:hypothetical protein